MPRPAIAFALDWTCVFFGLNSVTPNVCWRSVFNVVQYVLFFTRTHVCTWKVNKNTKWTKNSKNKIREEQKDL